MNNGSKGEEVGVGRGATGRACRAKASSRHGKSQRVLRKSLQSALNIDRSTWNNS